MDNEEDEDLIDRLVDRLKRGSSGKIPDSAGGKYPKEALPRGTYARSVRFDQLGVITDAFYGELDADKQKIIIYTILLFPFSGSLSRPATNPGKYFITNEYEYEIIAYLMMNPVNLDQFTASLGRELFYEN
tara:strand:+ start:23 stop:415 length:393 start_codon:yes stop_codon:yes gene_type:complete